MHQCPRKKGKDIPCQKEVQGIVSGETVILREKASREKNIEGASQGGKDKVDYLALKVCSF